MSRSVDYAREITSSWHEFTFCKKALRRKPTHSPDSYRDVRVPPGHETLISYDCRHDLPVCGAQPSACARAEYHRRLVSSIDALCCCPFLMPFADALCCCPLLLSFVGVFVGSLCWCSVLLSFASDFGLSFAGVHRWCPCRRPGIFCWCHLPGSSAA